MKMINRDVLLNKNIRIETGSGAKYPGTIDFMDDIGLMFVPSNMNLNVAFITWGDIKKIMIDEERE